MSNLRKIAEATYVLPQEGEMRVPGLVIATEQLLAQMEIDRPLEQVRNVAHLPGIVGYSIAMPDIHWGYGFPIGGVAGMDIETGVISPGGVGYDINCGVRLAIIPIPFASISVEVKAHLLRTLFKYIPSGVGKGHSNKKSLSGQDYKELIVKGAQWSVEHGFGFKRDLENTESNGCILGAEIDSLSNHAKTRGQNQLGSIGSGNHFVEIGEVQKIFLPEIANSWGVFEGMTYALIHSGSRGFGHQVCQDTLNHFVKQGYAKNLPDKQLVAAPIKSSDGKNYFAAMAGAANFAFNNRQQLLHLVRKSFQEVMGISAEEILLVYDVCHNIAKFEEHEFEGKKRKLCVHRKGATRAFAGQPVLVPGDMERASYLMVGLGNPLTWSSSCHGAGRALSRVKSNAAWKGRDPIAYMKSKGVSVMASSIHTVSEEMPNAYKDVDQVVEAVQLAGLANMVARLRPHLVIKG